jgi:diguanylate cyclase (GGDEF)-like protein/PAS domain S-box-containing protein
MITGENFRALFDLAADALYILDPEGLIIEVNQTACQRLGYTKAEMLGKHIGIFILPEFAAKLEGRFANAMRQEYLIYESANVHKEGHILPIEVCSRAVELDGKPAFFNIVRDISERRQAESQYRESEEKWRQLFLNMTTGFALHDLICDQQGKPVDYRYIEINPAFEQLTGLKASDMVGHTVLEKLPGTEPYWIETFGRVALTGEPITYENYSRELQRWYQVRAFSPKIGQFAVIVTDITERKDFEDKLRLSSMVLENSSEGMVVTDADGLIVAVNPAFTSITGYSFEEVRGKSPRIMASGRHGDEFYREMRRILDSTGQWHGEMWDMRKDGQIQAKWLAINTIRKDDGTVHRYVTLFSDITERKLSEDLIWRQANFDVLTELPNRNMFRDRLGQEMKKSDRIALPLALLLIDLDKFKEVNDALGHAMGDLLLQEAALRIRACVRESDTLARLGGDEFTVILSAIAESSHVEDVAQKIVYQLAKPFRLGSEEVYVTASIGITLYPEDAADIDSLVKNADQAMYVAKNKGRNRFSYFTPSLQREAQNRLRMISDLRAALDAGQFRVEFQPIVELSTGNIHKAEALIRWQHPERGMVYPSEFIQLAEETGLIHEIGDWVFKESARWTSRWSGLGREGCQVSVNISPVQFQHGGRFCEAWIEYLAGLGLSGRNIVIEITEGLLLNAESEVNDKLLKFFEAGVQVAIDDFGTGYSSLSYIKQFDIDYLKIDQSFVYNLETDQNNMALTEAIIVMAHKLGLKVIAEGVETEGQRRLLLAAGCDYAQGYLLSEPLSPERFERLLTGMAR